MYLYIFSVILALPDCKVVWNEGGILETRSKGFSSQSNSASEQSIDLFTLRCDSPFLSLAVLKYKIRVVEPIHKVL
jgi:hypothetical protein